MNQEEIRVGKVVYKGDWSPENLAVVREVLDPLAFMVPMWAVALNVWWQPKGEGAICSNIEYDYRRCHLNFCPDFVASDAHERRYMVIHDLLHSFTSIVLIYAHETIESLLPENESPKFREHALRELETRNESATQDLAFCLDQWLSSQKPKR